MIHSSAAEELAEVLEGWPAELVPYVLFPDMEGDPVELGRAAGMNRRPIPQNPSDEIRQIWRCDELHDPIGLHVAGVGVVMDRGEDPLYVVWLEQPQPVDSGEHFEFWIEWPPEITIS